MLFVLLTVDGTLAELHISGPLPLITGRGRVCLFKTDKYLATFGISRSSYETGSTYKYLARGMTN